MNKEEKLMKRKLPGYLLALLVLLVAMGSGLLFSTISEAQTLPSITYYYNEAGYNGNGTIYMSYNSSLVALTTIKYPRQT
jgi:hypothetical protein